MLGPWASCKAHKASSDGTPLPSGLFSAAHTLYLIQCRNLPAITAEPRTATSRSAFGEPRLLSARSIVSTPSYSGSSLFLDTSDLDACPSTADTSTTSIAIPACPTSSTRVLSTPKSAGTTSKPVRLRRVADEGGLTMAWWTGASTRKLLALPLPYGPMPRPAPHVLPRGILCPSRVTTPGTDAQVWLAVTTTL